jgi:hypothetical protein
LTGSYNWDYTVADNRIKKLYELGQRIKLEWINRSYSGITTTQLMRKLVDPDEQLPHETLEGI